MPDDTSIIWVDATFVGSEDTLFDTSVVYTTATADVIGGYSIPVVYSTEGTEDNELDTIVVYFQNLTTFSGIDTTYVEYYSSPPATLSGLVSSIVEYNSGMDATISGTKNINVIFSTGYSSISGSLNSRVVFTAGSNLQSFKDTVVYFWNRPTFSGIIEKWVNYTNFCGSYGPGGFPITSFSGINDRLVQYGQEGLEERFGAIDRIVEIYFAGWPSWTFNTDVWSTILDLSGPFPFDVDTISGGLLPHYTEVYSCALTSSGISYDIFCSLMDLASLDYDVNIIPGRVWAVESDVYSALTGSEGLNFNVDLYPLKISNFMPAVGEYTTASGFISVDVTDDECPVSISGTYFIVDGATVSGTFTPIVDGYRMFLNPEDDFASFNGPTLITVHGEDECGRSLEVDYYLTFGYIVKYENHENESYGIDYGFDNKVVVRVTAEDYVSCPKLSSLAWDFDSRGLFNNDLGASIVGRFHADDFDNLSANIYPQSTAYFYGKEFTVVVNAKDFAGNQMEPLILTYKVEEKP